MRPPGSDTTRTYSTPTLERWLYAFKKGGLAALAPRARTDRGRGRDFDPVLRDLLCDIRREHPDVSVTLIVRAKLSWLAPGWRYFQRRPFGVLAVMVPPNCWIAA